MKDDVSVYDLVVVGAGPGGYVAAIRGAQLGMRVALVEAEALGGTCLNWGCIPTKVLLKSGQLFLKAQELASYGVQVEGIKADISSMVKRSRTIAATLSRGIQTLLKKNGITVYGARAKLLPKKDAMFSVGLELPAGPNTFGLEAAAGGAPKLPPMLYAPKVILATGGRSRPLPAAQGVEGLWSSKEAMLPESIPASLLIIGAGAIGLEFASFYRALGVAVTVVEMAPRILLTEDEDIARLAQSYFEKQGMKFILNSGVTAVKSVTLENKTPGFMATWDTKDAAGRVTTASWTGEKILVAIGVLANTENLGLEHTRGVVEQGRIQVNLFNETQEPGLYALGDVTQGPWLAHKASHEAILCVEAMAGHKVSPLDRSAIPACIYSYPQIASIGMQEKQARDAGIPLKVGSFPFNANGQSLAQGESLGLVKVLFHEDTGELLGAHMIGSQVTELIQSLAVAKKLEATEADLQHVIFPHPTLSEVIHEAVLDADNRALHKA